MSTSLFDLLVRELGRLLDPLTYALENPKALERLLASIGLPLADGDEGELTTALAAVGTLVAQIEQLPQESSQALTRVPALLDLSGEAFAALRGMSALSGPEGAFEGLGRDLADFLIGNYLINWHPLARDIAALLGLLETADEIGPSLPVVVDSRLVREGFFVDRFRFERIVDLLSDPTAALRDEYGSSLATREDARAVADRLFPRLLRVFRTLDVPSRYGFNVEDKDLLGDAAPFVERALVVYAEDRLAGAPAEAGLVLSFSSAEEGDLGARHQPLRHAHISATGRAVDDRNVLNCRGRRHQLWPARADALGRRRHRRGRRKPVCNACGAI